MPATLHIINLLTGEEYDLSLWNEETRIGRAATHNDVVLNDERVSRQHAVVRRSGTSYILVDMNSANGTSVNGEPIQEHLLSNNDEISIGDHRLVIKYRETTPVVTYDSEQIEGTVVMRSAELINLNADPGEAYLVTQPAAKSPGEETLSLRKKAETLSRLYELSRMLSSVFSLEDIFKKVSEMLFRTTAADRVVVLLKSAGSDNLSPFATELRNPAGAAGGEPITISRTILNRVLQERISLLSLDAQKDDRLAKAQSIMLQQVRSVICAPLLTKEAVLGVIYADCRQNRRIFTADDLDMLNTIAAQTSMAVDNAIKHDQLLKEALARAAYGRFMPYQVVEQILSDPNALCLGGTNQTATLLFSDVRGFTTLSEKLPPESVVQILNEYFSRMTPIVFEHRGVLDKYMGDGMMAIFGAPYSSEDSATSAIEAAISMQLRMGALNKELHQSGWPEISIGIGINTGPVTVGYIGSEQRMDYTAIGDAVNLAARLEKQAQPHQILISQTTLEAAGGKFRVAPFGEINIKGKSLPVSVFEVIY